MKLLFVDMVAPAPYTINTLKSYALGGTEATVLRVARGLARDGVDVALFQGVNSDRAEAVIDGIRHVGENASLSPDVIIHVRTAFFVDAFKEEYPKARHLVWLHDIVPSSIPEPDLAGQEIVCVSAWHLEQVLSVMADAKAMPFKDAHVIYNIVEPAPTVLPEKVPGRLGFFSSPHKGFLQVREAVFNLRKTLPELHLAYSNPGYLPNYSGGDTTWCLDLGQLPHHRVMEEMAKCEVLFQVQTVFPETFGLVMAEANAVGTSVISHNMGAAKEVLMGEIGQFYNEVIDCTDTAKVQAALQGLLGDSSHKILQVDPRFTEAAVIAEWKKLLGGK